MQLFLRLKKLPPFLERKFSINNPFVNTALPDFCLKHFRIIPKLKPVKSFSPDDPFF